MSTMKQWKSLTLQLKKIFEDLPSEKEREEIVGSINNLMKMLEEVGKSVVSMPTEEEASRAKDACHKRLVLHKKPKSVNSLQPQSA